MRGAQHETQNLDAELAGNKLIAALLQNRLSFELKIAQAAHEHRKDLAAELRTQQALNELAIRAAEVRKTPQERRNEAKEQMKQGQAERLVNARDKNRAASDARDEEAAARAKRVGFRVAENPGFRRAGEFVSPAAARARADFAARHAAPPGAAKGAEQAKDIKANTIIVTQIKPG